MTNKRRIQWAAAMIGLLTVGWLIWQLVKSEPTTIHYTTARIDRGDIRSYVTATGTVNPVNKVDVGSQLAGHIKTLYVELNANVRRGDPLAEIDPSPFQAQLKQARANLKKAREEMRMARNTMQENADLYRRGMISKEEYHASQSRHTVAQASDEQLQAALEMAQDQLTLTTIRAPIDGIVMSHQVTVGQAVTASSQGPSLFIIAEDLVKMQLDTNVSEADIGKIQAGQAATFSVDAYPDRTFEGRVWQIRNVPTSVQNVVMYNVALRIENPQLKLKPGMTAEVDILAASRQQVLLTPRAALRFTPPAGAHIQNAEEASSGAPVVWTIQPGGQLRAVPILPGISNDQYTELLSPTLRAGDEVVVEATGQGSSRTSPLGSVLPQPKRF